MTKIKQNPLNFRLFVSNCLPAVSACIHTGCPSNRMPVCPHVFSSPSPPALATCIFPAQLRSCLTCCLLRPSPSEPSLTLSCSPSMPSLCMCHVLSVHVLYKVGHKNLPLPLAHICKLATIIATILFQLLSPPPWILMTTLRTSSVLQGFS